MIQDKKVADFDWNQFSSLLLKLFKFTLKISQVPINADRWEEFIAICLKHMGKSPKWNLGSHKSGADIWIPELSISAKAGKIVNGCLIISSYRLTTFDTIDEMKRFIDEGKNFDVYLCCARNESKTGRTYSVYLVDADLIEASKLKWVQTKNGWEAESPEGIVLKIVKKMSNQLWMTIPTKLCNKIMDLTIPYSELGIDSAKSLEEESASIKKQRTVPDFKSGGE